MVSSSSLFSHRVISCRNSFTRLPTIIPTSSLLSVLHHDNTFSWAQRSSFQTNVSRNYQEQQLKQRLHKKKNNQRQFHAAIRKIENKDYRRHNNRQRQLQKRYLSSSSTVASEPSTKLDVIESEIDDANGSNGTSIDSRGSSPSISLPDLSGEETKRRRVAEVSFIFLN